MPGRHFAYFRQWSGECVREAVVPVRGLGMLRLAQGLGWRWLENRWATAISQPRPGEIGLDVTHLGFPVGDFIWARFDEVDRRLSFPEVHHFITVHRPTGFVTGNVLTGRPVRQLEDPAYAVVDVTGLGLANDGPYVHGRLALADGALVVEPIAAAPQLAAAGVDDALLEVPVRDAVLVGVAA